MQRFFPLVFLLGFLGVSVLAQSPTGGACPNIATYLEKLDLRDKVQFYDCREDRAFSDDMSDGKIFEILAKDPKWKKEKKRKFFAFYGHKGAVESWRYDKSPSLQIIRLKQPDGTYRLEIDTDRWTPGFKHFIREVVVHFANTHIRPFGIKIFGFMPKRTNQKTIEKELAKW